MRYSNLLIIISILILGCSDNTNNTTAPEQKINSISITLNGGGYSNETFKLETPDFIYSGAFVNDSLNSIYIRLFGLPDSKPNSISANISGTDTGQYVFAQNETYIIISMTPRTELYYMLSGIIDVKRIENLDGYIDGNFSGDFLNRTEYDTVSITGSFSLVHKKKF